MRSCVAILRIDELLDWRSCSELMSSISSTVHALWGMLAESLSMTFGRKFRIVSWMSRFRLGVMHEGCAT